ncbi:MAG: hypothetical protein WBA24_04860 [Geitlerinemataceae cyanobacterium]
MGNPKVVRSGVTSIVFAGQTVLAQTPTLPLEPDDRSSGSMLIQIDRIVLAGNGLQGSNS